MKLWRGQPDGWTWKPTRLDKIRFSFGFAAFFYPVAAIEFMWPSTPPHSGRWGWLYRLLSEVPPQNGYLVSMVIVGTFSLVAGIYHLKGSE